MKKNVTEKGPQEGRKPFFARLLETQELEQAAGGRTYHTLKYPSDGDALCTEKYPPIATSTTPTDRPHHHPGIHSPCPPPATPSCS